MKTDFENKSEKEINRYSDVQQKFKDHTAHFLQPNLVKYTFHKRRNGCKFTTGNKTKDLPINKANFAVDKLKYDGSCS